jgi:bifunctional UDP-N-acetylglucosamine pyrophosphorylase/glucosamine-1-phosphate N-acetyltransferase
MWISRHEFLTLRSKRHDQMIQAVIMAAGKSTRTYPLTLTRPKPLLKVANKLILEHQLDQLRGLAKEVILIVGYREEMIRAHFGRVYHDLPLRYITQKEQLGTGHAAMQVRDSVHGRFIILNGDDIYHRQDIKACLEHSYAILTQEIENSRDYGVLVMENELLRDIVEKSPNPPTRFANTGFYVLDETIFHILEKIERSPRGEYEITSAMKILAEHTPIVCQRVQKYWIPVAYPWSLLKVNEVLMKESEDEQQRVKKAHEILGLNYREYSGFAGRRLWGGSDVTIEDGVEIDGTVWVGSGSKIQSRCHFKGFVTIGNNCLIGAKTAIENSLIGDDVKIGPHCQISDSVFGEKLEIGQEFKTTCTLPGASTIWTKVKDTWVNTGQSRLGVIVGDQVRIGQNVTTYPGVSIDPGAVIPEGSVLRLS